MPYPNLNRSQVTSLWSFREHSADLRKHLGCGVSTGPGLDTDLDDQSPMGPLATKATGPSLHGDISDICSNSSRPCAGTSRDRNGVALDQVPSPLIFQSPEARTHSCGLCSVCRDQGLGEWVTVPRDVAEPDGAQAVGLQTFLLCFPAIAFRSPLEQEKSLPPPLIP